MPSVFFSKSPHINYTKETIVMDAVFVGAIISGTVCKGVFTPFPVIV
jgi:hypothetical protein